MPIDFDAIAAQFRAPLKTELKSIGEAFGVLSRWLSGQVKKANETERATRDLPALRFMNGAVAIWVDRSQHGALAPGEARRTLLDDIVAGARRFWDNVRFGETDPRRDLGLVGRMITEAGLYANTVEALRRGADVIDQAVARFLPPRPGVFSLTTPRTASDVFGGAALAVYAFLGGPTQTTGSAHLRVVIRDLRQSLRVASALNWKQLAGPVQDAARDLRNAFPFGGDGEEAHSWQVDPAVHPVSLTIPEMLAQAAQGIAGGLLILTLLPDLFSTLLAAGLLRLRVTVLDTFARIETAVFGLRRRVIDLFYTDLPTFGLRLIDHVVVVGLIVREIARFYAAFAGDYLRELVDNLVDYLDEVKWMVWRLGRVVDLVGGVVDAILNMNLREALLRAGGLPEWLLSGFPDTLGEIVTALTTGRARALREHLIGWLNEVNDLTLGYFSDRVEAAREVLGAVLVDVGHAPTVTYPAYTGPAFPDLYDTFMRGHTLTLEPLRRLTTRTVDRVITAGTTALGGIENEARTASRRSTRIAREPALRGVVSWVDDLARLVYGDQVDDLRQRTARPLTPMAQAYEDAFARGGFYTVGAVIPRYIDLLAEHWAERRLRQAEGRFAPPSGLPPYAAPTSPHRIDRRARLGRVRMPRLTVRLGRRDLDDDLGTAVATRFKAEVQTAYVTGLNRMPD